MINQLPLFQEEPDTRIDEILSSPKDYTYIFWSLAYHQHRSTYITTTSMAMQNKHSTGRVHRHIAKLLLTPFLCLSTSHTWKSLYELAPEMVQKLADKEQEINHTIYHTKKGGTPLMQHIEKGVSFLKEGNVLRWKSEALGEFTSPIIIDEWTYPQGAFSSESGGSA